MKEQNIKFLICGSLTKFWYQKCKSGKSAMRSHHTSIHGLKLEGSYPLHSLCCYFMIYLSISHVSSFLLTSLLSFPGLTYCYNISSLQTLRTHSSPTKLQLKQATWGDPPSPFFSVGKKGPTRLFRHPKLVRTYSTPTTPSKPTNQNLCNNEDSLSWFPLVSYNDTCCNFLVRRGVVKKFIIFVF